MFTIKLVTHTDNGVIADCFSSERYQISVDDQGTKVSFLIDGDTVTVPVRGSDDPRYTDYPCFDTVMILNSNGVPVETIHGAPRPAPEPEADSDEQ